MLPTVSLEGGGGESQCSRKTNILPHWGRKLGGVGQMPGPLVRKRREEAEKRREPSRGEMLQGKVPRRMGGGWVGDRDKKIMEERN